MLEAMGEKARQAARQLALSPGEQRDRALTLMAQALTAEAERLIRVNEGDIQAAADLSSAMIDRLRLTRGRIDGMAQALRELCALPDPLHRTLWEDTQPNGLHIRRVSVPLGVLAVIYESRPNVTLDAAAMAIKSGNAVILRGGREAIGTNTALCDLIRDCLQAAGLPQDSAQLVTDTSRASALALMQLKPYVDLLIPRGGHGLIQSALEHATVPVLETGEGVCHIYVDRACDLDMATAVTLNAKVSRPSTCNAAECLLVHRDIAPLALPRIAAALVQAGVALRGDRATCRLVPQASPAQESDWGREFNDLILAVKVVDDIDGALRHIARYGTGHSEAIITSDEAAKQRFFDEVDAAAVYHNASTRFTDGGEFGFGAEIGIATQKLHCRGPVGINNLTSWKYLVEGEGQTR
ncbi:MAG: glutamate-5-semialdehyde dehydrogenase [Christensenellales bacterium]